MAKNKNTLFGFISILLWSTAAAFTRTLSEDLGAFTAAASVHLIAGILAVLYQRFSANGTNRFRSVPKAYWLICGFFYILYVTCSYLSVGLAQSREQVMIIILIKFLWPMLTLLFTIPILGSKASPLLIMGVMLSFTGIVIANLGTNVADFGTFQRNITGNAIPYLLGLTAAVSWALYSNFSRKLVGDSDGGAGFFILITGIVLGSLSFAFSEPRQLSSQVVGQLLYQAIFTSFVATLMWDAAMRKGNVILVAIVSTFLPLVTTVVSALLLGVNLGLPIWIGALLVVSGTALSKRSFQSEVVGSIYHEQVS
jgi:drug/metabolite transporter (DMT)-like permease